MSSRVLNYGVHQWRSPRALKIGLWRGDCQRFSLDTDVGIQSFHGVDVDRKEFFLECSGIALGVVVLIPVEMVQMVELWRCM